MNRIALVPAVLLASIAVAQPATYFVPIAGRTPLISGTSPAPTIALPDPGVSAALSILFSTGGGTVDSFLLGSQVATPLTGFPAPADAVAAAPGVLVKGQSRTLVAVVSGPNVVVGTFEAGGFVARGPSSPLPGSAPIALSAGPDGGAVLLVSDSTGTNLTRWELDVSGDTAVAVQGLSQGVAISSEPARGLFLDAIIGLAFVGTVPGNVFQLAPYLDAGSTLFDATLTSQGRLAPPVTGVDVYLGASAAYLLVTSAQGLTVYDLTSPTPRADAFRVIAQDSFGSITGPTGVAVTNLPAGTNFPSGAIALGDSTLRGVALLSWGTLAGQVDGGLAIDTTFDPRGPGLADGGGGVDGGADGGQPDAGGGGGGGSASPGGGGPLGPGIPVQQPSSCASAPGGSLALVLLAAVLLWAPRRRQRP